MAESRPMRALMLSWEYPPVVVGGLGRHVHALAGALVRGGAEVTVVTRHQPGAPLEEVDGGVRVVRVPEDPPLFPLTDTTLLAWTMAFNHALTRGAITAAGGPFDVVHAHDWLVTHAAVTLKHHLGVPLVATVHATEAGRHQGWLPSDTNRCIHSVEWWLTFEARRVVVCSTHMRWEVTRLFDLPAGKVEVIGNGVDDGAWRPRGPAVAAARSRYGGDGPLLVYAGRLVYEKGVQDLLAAVPRLRRRHPGLRVVIAGDGPHRDELAAQARRRRLGSAVTFCGFRDAATLPALLAAADCVVVPSIYEPFGMVALEAAAAGTPVAVAASGGLTELVDTGVAATRFPAKDPAGLADAVSGLLTDQLRARRQARRARDAVREYAWPAIAARTVDCYHRAIRDERALTARLAGEMPRIEVPEGNLLTGDG